MADRIHFMLLINTQGTLTCSLSMRYEMSAGGVRESQSLSRPFNFLLLLFFVDDCCGTVKHKKERKNMLNNKSDQ